MTEPLIKVPDVQFERAKLMLDRASWAAAKMQKLDRATTRRIVDAVAAAGHAKAQAYAEWAVRETGMGVVEHKRIKNEASTKGLVELYGNEDFISPRIDPVKKIVELPRPAGVIAREAGFNASGAKILVTPVNLVQPEEKLVREKLCPVLAFARVQTIDQAISAARSMMRKSGKGHSAAIHSKNEANIMAYAAAVPALRVVVNTGCSLGASGYETNLGPSMTIGTGFVGGSSIGDNLTPHHLLHYARIAYNKDASESFGNFTGLDPLNMPKRDSSPVSLAVDNSSDSELRKELRRIILEELKAVLAA